MPIVTCVGRAAAAALAATFALAAQAATITVNSLGDAVANDGACTLREAITAANGDAKSGNAAGECAAGSGADTIVFSVAGTIRPKSALPTITTPVHVDGYTAPGALRNTLPLAQGTNAVLKIEIDGADAGNVAGLTLSGNGASGTIIEGLAINNSANPECCAQLGILVSSVAGAATTVVRGNFIGTDLAGREARSKGAASVFLSGTVKNFVLGAPATGVLDNGARNLISGGSNYAITASPADNFVARGNLIGTDATGTFAIPNTGYGFLVDSLANSLIADNVISGNSGTGIFVRAGSANTVIRNNFIGTNAAGTAALPNQFGGIRVEDNPFDSPRTVSGLDIDDNVIAYNTSCANCSAGIVIGNTNKLNTTVGIRLARNVVYANGGLQIDLAPSNGANGVEYGVTANDAGDADTGPNALQNYPVLAAASGNGTLVSIPFTYNGEAGKSVRLEFFQAPACDASGHGGASVYLGTVTVTTDAGGNASGTASLSSPLVAGAISATATNAVNGTSELSACVALTGAVAGSTANYQGLWWASPAGSESGWGVNLNHQGNTIFATWFTYGLDGKPLWLVVSAVRTAADSDTYTGDLYTGTGPSFSAFDPALVVPQKVGSASFTFADATSATFAYTVNGVSQSKPLVRQQFASPVPACAWGSLPTLALATNFQDLWWRAPAGSEPGWGVNLTHQGDTIFLTWFTFGADGKPLWFAVAAAKSAPNVYQGTLYQAVSGPPFNAVPFDAAKVSGTPVGPATLAFADGNNATFSYTVGNVSQTKAITREVFTPPGTACQ